MSIPILVPLDGSGTAEHALAAAVAIALRSDGTVHLCRVCVPSGAESSEAAAVGAGQQRAHALTYLRALRDRLVSAWGIRVRVGVRVGAVAESVLREADLIGAELIVLGTHGQGETGPRWLGSTADELMHRADVPVLLLPPRAGRVDWDAGVFQRVLLPAEAPLDPEAILAGAELLHPHGQASYRLLALAGDDGAAGDGVAEEALHAVAAWLGRRGAEATSLCASGRPAPAVMQAAREFAAELILFTLPAKHDWRPQPLSALQEKLARLASLPLLLHRPTARRALDLPALALPSPDDITAQARL